MQAGVYPTATGEVELRADPWSPGGWEVFVNGVPSSHISVDPLVLEFEYMRWMAVAIDDFVSRYDRQGALRVTHLGGGACSMARYMVARHPRSHNTVVEIDGTLASLVRQWFDLPRAPQLKIRVGDARAVIETATPGTRDVIIRDVFAGAVTPASCGSREFFTYCHRALAPGGLLVANCGDGPDLMGVRNELKTVASVFAEVAVIADPPMLKGRRRGNVVIVASDTPIPDSPQVTKALLGGGVPATFRSSSWVRSFCSSGAIVSEGV